MTRIGKADFDDKHSFKLTFHKAGGHVRTLQKLIRIAREASSDEEFTLLLGHESVSADNALLRLLGENPRLKLRQTDFVNLPIPVLDHNSKFLARLLCGNEADGIRLKTHLFEKFSRGATERTAFSIAELVEAINSQGIPLTRPKEITHPNATPVQQAVLVILQTSVAPLPLPVVAYAVTTPNTSKERLLEELEPLFESRLLELREDRLSFGRVIHSSFTLSDEKTVLSRLGRPLGLHSIA